MLNNIETMTYKPVNSNYTYIGTIEKSVEDNCYYGKVLDIEAVITYESNNKEGLHNAFEESVKDYINLVNEKGNNNETK